MHICLDICSLLNQMCLDKHVDFRRIERNQIEYKTQTPWKTLKNQIRFIVCIVRRSVSKWNVYHLYNGVLSIQRRLNCNEKSVLFSLVFFAHFNFVYRFPFRLWHCTVLEMCVWFLFIVWRTRFGSIDWILIDCYCCLHANVLTIKHTCFFIVVLFLETERACVHVMSIAKQQTEQVNVEMYGKRKPKKCTYHSGDVSVCVCVRCSFAMSRIRWEISFWKFHENVRYRHQYPITFLHLIAITFHIFSLGCGENVLASPACSTHYLTFALHIFHRFFMIKFAIRDS